MEDVGLLVLDPVIHYGFFFFFLSPEPNPIQWIKIASICWGSQICKHRWKMCNIALTSSPELQIHVANYLCNVCEGSLKKYPFYYIYVFGIGAFLPMFFNLSS